MLFATAPTKYTVIFYQNELNLILYRDIFYYQDTISFDTIIYIYMSNVIIVLI